jgi:ABC-2 type transport system ATP-binding protein
MAGDAAIEVVGLTRRFGERVALRGISFRIEPGEVVAFLGPNGAGKSTAIHVLTGQLERDAGEVRVLDLDPRGDAAAIRRQIAFLPERAPLYDVLTPREQLEFVAGVRGLDGRTAAARAAALIEAIGIEDLADLPLAHCSRGNRQRAALACAFVEAPRLVILDEPLFGLDAATVLLVKEILRRLAARGVAVFYSSHLLDVAENLATRVVMLKEGEIVADGAPARLLQDRGGSSLEGLFRELTQESGVEERAERFLTATRLAP